MSYNFPPREYPSQHTSSDFFMSGQQGMAQGMALGHVFEAPAMRPPENPYANLAFLKQVSRQALLASENPAFLELFEENVQLKAELKAKNVLLSRSMENSQVPVPNERLAPPASGPIQSTIQPDRIQIPASPAAYMREDYPDARFWTRTEWNNYTHSLGAKGVRPRKLEFLTDQDGNPVDEERISTMSKEAKLAWATLHYYRLSPENWGARLSIAGDFFSNYMRTKFPEFRLCENDWKVDLFATVRYSEWKPTRNSGTLLRQNPSIKPPQKIKKEKVSASRQVIPQKRHRVDPKDVIELESDSELEAGRPKAKKHNVKPISSTPAIATSSVPAPLGAVSPRITTSGLSPAPASVAATPTVTTPGAPSPRTSVSVSASTGSVLERTETELTPDVSPLSNQTGSETAPAPSAAPSVLPTPPAPASSTLPPPAPTSSTPVLPTPPAPTSSTPSAVASPVLPPTLSAPIPEDPKPSSRTRNVRRNGANILSNMKIPSPNPDLIAPVQESDPNAPSVSTSKATASRGGKADKLVKDNGTTSARNLYAIDYIKVHGPTTVAAFKDIWDNLDAETAKKYKALSANAKKGT